MAEPSRTDRDRRWWWAVGAIAAVILGFVAVLVIVDDDDDDTVTGGDTTTSTTIEDTTTTAPSSTTTEPTSSSTSTTVVDTTTAVFPFADSDLRFTDPMEAVEYWAEGYVGFVDPVYSDYMAGDSRSGEVVVRPTPDGPETVVLVRQLDDTWWILGSIAEHISVDEPQALDRLTSPVALSGTAVAFEGQVSVELWTDGAEEPLAMTFVTGGGDEPRPFEGTLSFDQQPATDGGALLFRPHSGEDGRVWEASVLRVRF